MGTGDGASMSDSPLVGPGCQQSQIADEIAEGLTRILSETSFIGGRTVVEVQ